MRGLLRRGATEDPGASLRAVLGDQELPSFPSVVTTALEKVAQSETDLEEVSEVVSTDPGLTVHLLRLVNSPSFATRSQVTSVHQAVCLLGRNQLESVLITVAVNNAMPTGIAPGYDPESFWFTAAYRAAAAASVATNTDPSRRSEHFTAALLQDMAIPLLAHNHPPYSALLAGWSGSHSGLAEFERETFGWTHAEVATWMCEAWRFPDSLIAAIATHHDPADDSVGIARWVAHIDGNGFDAERLAEATLDLCGLGEYSAGNILESARDEAGEIAALFL